MTNQQSKIRTNNALIIGNGFDINLGMPTSYKDFINSNFFDTKNRLFGHLKDQNILANWIDIELELKKYLLVQKESLENSGARNVQKGRLHQSFLEGLNLNFRYLKNQLKLYLIDIEKKFEFNEESLEKVRKVFGSRKS